MTMIFRAQREFWNAAISMHIASRDEAGRVQVCEQMTLSPPLASDFAAPFEPALRLRVEEAQALMDELWGVGLRPSEGTGSAGSLAATERHLKDMQRIAMSLLKIGEAT